MIASRAMRRIAFFDVDRTILSVNSASLWLRRELRGGHLSWRHALRGAAWLALYALGLARMERVIADALRVVAGHRAEDLAARTRSFYEDELRARIRPAVRAVIERHRDAGDALWLLTTSSTWLSAQLAEELGFDGYLCNRLEDEAGLLTGRAHAPLCFGEGKVTHAQALAQRAGVSLADCVFYTDSYSDLPMLLAVGEPVVVNPDPRLRREAARRGWPVRDWGVPPRRDRTARLARGDRSPQEPTDE